MLLQRHRGDHRLDDHLVLGEDLPHALCAGGARTDA